MKEEQKLEGKQINISFPTSNAESKPAKVKEENKQSLIEALTKKSDEIAQESFLLRTQRENEKIKFIGGAEYSINDIKNFVITNARPYSPMFPNDNPYFSEMYRLNGWDDRDPNEWIKPLPVPYWMNELIYQRFPTDVLPALNILNQFLPGLCIRAYKHFQFLNEEGQKKVMEFRDEAVTVMKTCNSWHEFRLKFIEYGVPYTYQSTMSL